MKFQAEGYFSFVPFLYFINLQEIIVLMMDHVTSVRQLIFILFLSPKAYEVGYMVSLVYISERNQTISHMGFDARNSEGDELMILTPVLDWHFILEKRKENLISAEFEIRT